MDFFNPNLDENELLSLSNLALAHVGDGVFELMVRTSLAATGRKNAHDMHRRTVKLVAAPAQAKLAEKILPLLTEKELEGIALSAPIEKELLSVFMTRAMQLAEEAEASGK